MRIAFSRINLDRHSTNANAINSAICDYLMVVRLTELVHVELTVCIVEPALRPCNDLLTRRSLQIILLILSSGHGLDGIADLLE